MLVRRFVAALLLAGCARVALVHAAVPAAAAMPDTARLMHSAKGRYMSAELAAAESVLKARGGSHAEHAQLLLTWDAPYGLKRARTMRTPRCGDASANDTLYLSFLPGRASDTFSGFTALLQIHATLGDTLGPFWHFERGGANAGQLSAEWDQVADFPGRRPYHVPGQGLIKLEHTPQMATLRMIYAVSHELGSHLAADSIYALGRVILRHQKLAAGCDKPVCIEWRKGTFAFALKDEPEVARGERFVGFGPAGSDPTAGFAMPAPKAWKPKPPGAAAH